MSKKKGKKKGDDLDALLAEMGYEQKKEDEANQQQKEEGKEEKEGKKEKEETGGKGETEQNEEKEKTLTKAQKKKEKMKQKKEQMKKEQIETETHKETEKDENKVENKVENKDTNEEKINEDMKMKTEEIDGEEKEKQKDANLQKKKKKKGKAEKTHVISDIAKAAAERLRLIREYEQKKKEEEERLRIEEEERIKKEEEERERKKQEKLEKKMQLKREGKLLTAKEKEEKLKNEIYLKSLKESGLLVEPGEKVKRETIQQTDTTKPKSFLKKKKKNKAVTSKKGENEEKEKRKSEEELLRQKQEEEDEMKKKKEEEIVVEDWEDFLKEDKGDEEEDDDEHNEMKRKNHNTGKEAQNQQKQSIKKKEEKGTQNEELKKKKKKEKEEDESDDGFEYRSSIVCVLGHVDTGKTKLLDKLRHTNVQDNEAGGITQQIGATFFPKEVLDAEIKKIDRDIKCVSNGIMIIDTPGHESFYNLRKRGSSLCDIAILVIDLMHGLEQQTKESIQILKQRNCPFVIALNKIDRLYMWEKHDWSPFNDTFKKQKPDTQGEFNDRLHQILNELSEQGLNCNLYWENTNLRKYVSIVPTSALTGEGIPDLIMIIVKLTQTFMLKKMAYQDKLECTVLEVKNVEGLGTTIDVILTNGTLRESDTIVLCGLNGPIITMVRALLTPQPLKELRIKNEYIHHKHIKACIGVKISANNLEEVICGTSLFVANTPEHIEECKKKVMTDISSVFDHVDKSGVGLYVMASTLGSLEALLIFLNDSKIPVFAVNIGTVQKKDVKKASIMREKGRPEYSVILAFDVKVDPDAVKEAAILGVEIMAKDIIYHLFDCFTEHMKKIEEEKKKNKLTDAVFPCELEIIADCIFNKKDPLIMGVKIVAGILKIGTPLFIPEKNIKIGSVLSIELNKKGVEKATKNQEVCIKVGGEPHITYGRHFDSTQKVYSKITRENIDVLKEFFRNELTMDDWKLVLQLKKIFNII